ncbi:hypothetical protein ABWH97_00090 [Nitratireductor sp. ac15]
MVDVLQVESLFSGDVAAPAGYFRLGKSKPAHAADGMTVTVSMGGGAYGTIINPQSFSDGGPEWVMRYGNPESIRYTVASLLETFDHLLSDGISAKEASRRLIIMRSVRRALGSQP